MVGGDRELPDGVGYDGEVLSGEGEVDAPPFASTPRSTGSTRSRPAVLHTHMPFATALARLEEPRLAALGQTEIACLDTIAYDDEYTGLALDPAEGERLAHMLGPDRGVLLMANHGVYRLRQERRRGL